MANSEHFAVLSQGREAWNQWRLKHGSRVDLSGVHLPGKDLRGTLLVNVDLGRADLRRAMLSGVDLKRSRLSEAILRNADLSGADLEQVRLRDAQLQRACLVNANFKGAYLVGANLQGADLKGADFSLAQFGWTVLGDLDLRNVKGLETVYHAAPSTIGTDTVYQSKGRIPELFLRGCGVQDAFMTFARSLVGDPIEFYSCFISYSHADKSFAVQLHDTLQNRGIRCWLDEKQLLPGHDIYDEVDRGVRLWDKVLLCCSQKSLTSWWVDLEIATAFEKEQQLTKQRGWKVQTIIPLNIDGYLFSEDWISGYRAEIRRRLAADFTGKDRDQNHFDTQIENLVRALRAGQAARQTAPMPKL